MLSDILATGYEIGVLKGEVKPGSTVAIVGAGPVGLAALSTVQFYSSSKIIMLDLDDNRLATAKELGATHTINSTNVEDAVAQVKTLNHRGADVAIEDVGTPQTFDLCQKLIGVDGQSLILVFMDYQYNLISINYGLRISM